MMNSEQKHTDFSLYTFEEFLQNDFFISSMNHPTEETQKFWDEFEQMNPSNIDEYIAAKRYLEVFSKEKGSSSNLVVISFLFQLSSSFLILLKVVDMFAF